MVMKIQLSDHFTYKRLMMFALPSIAAAVFTSVYGIVDGFFVSNFVGKTAFAAVNFIMPVLIILGGLGFIIGTGGSALVGKTLGEGDRQKANSLFSLLIYTAAGAGVVLAVIGIIFIPDMAYLLGARGQMLEDCILYGRLCMISMPAYMLQFAFQSFFITAEKPQLGFAVTVSAGITNIVLDFVFIAVFHWGIAGAALATAASEILGGVIPFVYFFGENSSLLKLTGTGFDGRALIKTCTNGASEFVTSISTSVLGVVYNIQLLRYFGEDGVAAYGVLMYASYIFLSIFFGYMIGTAPVFSYNYGAENHGELKNVLKKSLVIICTLSIVIFAVGQLLAGVVVEIFVGYDEALRQLTLGAFRIFAISFIVSGFNVFGSGFFTALNNGLISAVVSFMRTMVFEIGAVLLLPLILGASGIWSAIIVAELAAVILTLFFMVKKKNVYHYW